MWSFTKKRLGDVLLESGTITHAQLEEALSSQKASGMKLGELLVAKGYVTKRKIIQVLEKQLNIPVHALITMQDLMDYLKKNNRSDDLAKMQAYREKYGV